jgi:hypothetical protein
MIAICLMAKISARSLRLDRNYAWRILATAARQSKGRRDWGSGVILESMLAVVSVALLPALAMTLLRATNNDDADAAFMGPHPCSLSSTNPQA